MVYSGDTETMIRTISLPEKLDSTLVEMAGKLMKKTGQSSDSSASKMVTAMILYSLDNGFTIDNAEHLKERIKKMAKP
jgi:hypothetical protein